MSNQGRFLLTVEINSQCKVMVIIDEPNHSNDGQMRTRIVHDTDNREHLQEYRSRWTSCGEGVKYRPARYLYQPDHGSFQLSSHRSTCRPWDAARTVHLELLRNLVVSRDVIAVS